MKICRGATVIPRLWVKSYPPAEQYKTVKSDPVKKKMQDRCGKQAMTRSLEEFVKAEPRNRTNIGSLFTRFSYFRGDKRRVALYPVHVMDRFLPIPLAQLIQIYRGAIIVYRKRISIVISRLYNIIHFRNKNNNGYVS